MYATSASYKASQLRRVRESKISGTLGDGITLDETIVVLGSLYYDNQCYDNDSDISIGTCCIGELGFTLRDTDHNKDYFFGKNIDLTYSQNVGTRDDPVWEDIPIGHFRITDGTERISRNEMRIVAYDNMSRLDVPPDGHIMIGTPAELLETMCGLCGVGFGGISEDLPNQSIQIIYNMDFYAEYIATMRDAVSYLCQILCGFGVIGRDGCFYVRSLVPKATPDLTIGTAQRKSTKMADRTVTVSGISMELTKSLLGVTEIIQYPADPDAGKILTLSDNPYLQQMSGTNRRAAMQAVAETAMQISYRPTDIDTFGDASLDVGDTIQYTGYICGDSVTSLITHLHWQFRGTQQLASIADTESGIYIPQMVQTNADDYDYDIIGGEYVRIIRYIGAEPRIILPMTIEDLPVKQILEGSFTGTCVIRVSIPDSVEVIN